jgi:putative colanic acid biosynthesis UDP-glucose lipid carrier transferase
MSSSLLQHQAQLSRRAHSKSMFDDRTYKRNFFTAPQSITSLVAALLEPVVTVLTFLATSLWFGDPIERPQIILCLLVFALTFPGRNRFREAPLSLAIDVVSSWAVFAGLMLLCGYVTNSLGFYSSQALLTWAIATPVLQCVAILLGRQVVMRRAVSVAVRRTAIVVGAGPLGAKVATMLQNHPDLGSSFTGFFDDRGDVRVEGVAMQKLLGRLSDAAAYIREKGINEVYITLPLGSQPRIIELLEQLQGTTASIFYVPDVFGISIIQGRLQDLGGIPLVGICETPFTGTNELVKRISDIILSSIILVLISPILLVLAIGVKLSSPGPVIFKQRRNGLDGKEIMVYKFRSMRTMDNGPVVRQASKDDPRITPFGAFIRRTSLDELPQFFNVLQGRMSIVGPRPHAVAHNEQYRQLIKAYMVRHKVKPGITGWAQINGYRGETETIDKMRARVEYDLEYLRNWSLALDLKIILRTVPLMILDRSAY